MVRLILVRHGHVEGINPFRHIGESHRTAVSEVELHARHAMARRINETRHLT
jgi:hypothetical protein